MEKKYAIAGIVVAVIVGFFVGKNNTQLLGGDFAGGVVPNQLFTASVSTNSVTPILSNLYVPGAVSVGGVAANNQVTVVYTATTNYPVSQVTLGPVTANNSATSTSFLFSASGFSVGDSCEVGYNGNTSTAAFGADAFVTAVSGSSVTTTATFWNGSTASTTLNVTSTATGVSSTLKATCFHTGV